MKMTLFGMILLLYFCFSATVFAGSLYEEVQDVCTDKKDRIVVVSAKDKVDISVNRENNALQWSRGAFKKLVYDNKYLFVIRCTSKNEPFGAIPQVYPYGSVDDIERVIEMEFLANSVAHDRNRYTFVFHAIANFSKEAFIVFDFKSSFKKILLDVYSTISADEREIKHITYQVAGTSERVLNIYPKKFSDEANKAREQYNQFFYDYLQKLCPRALEKKELKICELANAYDFAIRLLRSPVRYFFYVHVYEAGHLPMILHLTPRG